MNNILYDIQTIFKPKLFIELHEPLLKVNICEKLYKLRISSVMMLEVLFTL